MALVLAGALAARSIVREQPDADAAGLFPQTIPASSSFNHNDAQLFRSWAASPARIRFKVRVPNSAASQLYFVMCDHGRIEIDFGGSTASRPCTGHVDGLIGNPYGPGHGASITVRVTEPQTARWGVAVYGTRL
jgi:hypothetical protein